MFYMKQNKKRTQSLEGAQYGLEIILKRQRKHFPCFYRIVEKHKWRFWENEKCGRKTEQPVNFSKAYIEVSASVSSQYMGIRINVLIHFSLPFRKRYGEKKEI